MPKYSLKVANRWGETIGVDDCHSIDEAYAAVEKALYQRDLTIARRLYEAGKDCPPDLVAKVFAVPESDVHHVNRFNNGFDLAEDVYARLVKAGSITPREPQAAPVQEPEPAPAPAPAPEAPAAAPEATTAPEAAPEAPAAAPEAGSAPAAAPETLDQVQP